MRAWSGFTMFSRKINLNGWGIFETENMVGKEMELMCVSIVSLV